MRPIAGIATVAAVLSTAAVAVTSTQAAGTRTSTRPEVLHLKFRRAGNAFSVVTDGGRYAFVNNPPGPPPGPSGSPPPPEHFSGGTLVDEETGSQKSVPRTGCYGIIVGAPWLMFYCPSAPRPTYELYSIPQHRVVRAGIPADTGMNPVAIGKAWIRYFVVKTGAYIFQNIKTQKTRTLSALRPGGRVIPDLNSPTLARKLCSPLRVPSDWAPYARWSTYPHNEKLHAGTVTFLDSLAIAQGTTRPDSRGNVVGEAYAERCGSRVKRLVAGVGEVPVNAGIWFANADALITGGDYDRNLQGWALPGLEPISIPVPGYDQGLMGPYQMSLSSRRLYLVDAHYELWVARGPALAG
jgi:hypothetical protein